MFTLRPKERTAVTDGVIVFFGIRAVAEDAVVRRGDVADSHIAVGVIELEGVLTAVIGFQVVERTVDAADDPLHVGLAAMVASQVVEQFVTNGNGKKILIRSLKQDELPRFRSAVLQVLVRDGRLLLVGIAVAP